jgi:hypothetical protein
LLHWYRLHRERVIVKVDRFHGTPLQLVQAAANQLKVDRRDQARGRGDAFDEYWCVYDVDQHPGLAAALELANEHDINIALSNPCIELWFLLHFTDRTAALDRHEAQRQSRILLDCGKVLSPAAIEKLTTRHREARANAQSLDKKHEGDGSPPHSNPSSDIWRIVDTIRAPVERPEAGRP